MKESNGFLPEIRKNKQKMGTVLYHTKENMRNSEGSFVRLADGRILFAYSRYSGSGWDDICKADIWGVISSDNGESWGAPRMILENPAQNLMSVSLLRLHSGRIAMVYLKNSEVPGWPHFISCHPFIRFSDDEAESWSDPVDIAQIPPHYIMVHNERLIQLSSGRLLLPSAFTCWGPYRKGNYPGLHPGFGVIHISDDEGKNWRPAEEACFPPSHMHSGLQEPGVIELKDGSILCWYRTGDGCQYKSYSYDGGDHWTDPIPAVEFRSPGAPLSMKRDPVSGDLVAIWNDYHPQRGVRFTDGIMGRTPLVLARSSDEGKSWDRHRILEDSPDHGFGYTAMLFNEGKLLLGYCCGGKPDCESMLQDLKLCTVEL